MKAAVTGYESSDIRNPHPKYFAYPLIAEMYEMYFIYLFLQGMKLLILYCLKFK